MNDPELYHKAHKKLKRDIGDIYKQYFTKFQWRNNGTNIFMDVGSGPGDVLVDYIYPLLPKPFHKVISTDMSKEMLEFSQMFYQNPEKFEYRVLNIATNELPMDLKGTVHQITASLVLHWIKDFGKGTAMKNLYDLLHPEGGDCLMIIVPYIATLYANDTIKTSPKWRHYLEGINEFVPTSADPKELQQQFHRNLEEAGFCDVTIEEVTRVEVYETLKEFRDTIRSVCTMLKFIPDCEKEEFFNDFMDLMVENFSGEEEAKQMNAKYGTKYRFIVAHGKKLPQRNL